MEYLIREMRTSEYGFLEDFLYEAIFVPQGAKIPPRSITKEPALQVYIADFGTKQDDVCFVAEYGGNLMGAVWVRDMPDYGHIADGIPSFALSLYPQCRGRGIGTALMKRMLEELKKRGYSKASLSVQKANYAARMYLKLGFKICAEKEEEYLMMIEL